MLMTQKNSKTSAYAEIILMLRSDIHRGKYSPGEQLPTLIELAKEYGVSHSTVRIAFRQLASEGLLEVHQGRGTFVAAPTQAYNPTEGFVEQYERLEKSVQTKLIETRWLDPHKDAAQILQLADNEQVWSIFILYYLDDLPACAEVLDIPRSLAEHFLGNSRMLRSVFRVLREDIGYKKIDVDVIGVDVLSEQYYHDLLGTPAGTITYEIRRVVSYKGEPLILSYVALRSDKFRLDFLSNMQRFIHINPGDGDIANRHTHRQAMRERFSEESFSVLP